MEIRAVTSQDKPRYDTAVSHPLQSWQWGEFRKQSGLGVIRLGRFDAEKLVETVQMTIHQLPITNYTIGYIPKSGLPSQELVTAIKNVAEQNNCILIKWEPNVIQSSAFSHQISTELKHSPYPLFTKYTFLLDLTQTEEQLLKNMHPKARYNIKVAQKHGVTITEENSEEAFSTYLRLTQETTKRQGFYAHTPAYHTTLWNMLGPKGTGMAHLFTARYQGKILVTWMLFLFNNVLYYPYGASSNEHRDVMASTLMMWETIRWGKLQKAHTFDLWGTPGPRPNPSDPYFGFHQFKERFGPQLVEFIGTYDQILKQPHYQLFNLAHKLRWLFLKIRR